MHDVVIEGLERHLSGGGTAVFYAHLEGCPECRSAVAEMESLSLLFRELRSGIDNAAGSAPEPRLGFYNRVAGEIIDHQRKEAWGLFSPGAVFFRRVAFASLLLLAGLGSYLVSRESSFTGDVAAGQDAAAIMAEHDTGLSHSEASDRNRMLVALATYRE
jgi:anti-sigma factor RsiW